MKKNNFLLVLAATFLTLTACGGKGSSKTLEPEVDPKEYVEPEVELDDIESPTMDIYFDDIEETCMVNPKAKDYIDDMEEQEKTLERPYHFSSLYGPEDYAKMAAASDTNDGVTYPDAQTGGVDVCQYLSRNDYGNDCKNYPIKLTWDDDGTFNNAVVKFWSTEDQSDVREVNVKIQGNKVIAELPNLYRARKYRVQVFTESDVSQGFEFVTGDYQRTITMGGIHNVRDLGGYVTSYGVRTNQGLIYRGYYIDDGNPSSHGKNYTDEAEAVNQEVMKIGLEIDLQGASEAGNRTKSALQGADYKCKTLVSYDNFLKQDSYKNLPEVIHDLAHADEKHVYFHCWGGADRTGMLAFFLNAILGVSYTDLIEDFELTTQTNNKRCHMHNASSAHFPKFLNEFINNWDGFDPDATVNENCEKWLLEVPEDLEGNKVDPDDIERIREIMLPGYADGELEKDQLIREYTAEDEWQTDALSGWQIAEENPDVKCNWHRHQGEPCSICGYGDEVTPAPSSSEPSEEVDYLLPLSRVWKEGTAANNSDGKQYIPLSEEATGKVGVKIKFSDYSPDSTGSISRKKIQNYS